MFAVVLTVIHPQSIKPNANKYTFMKKINNNSAWNREQWHFIMNDLDDNLLKSFILNI